MRGSSSTEKEAAAESVLPPATTREPMRERPVGPGGAVPPAEPFYSDAEGDKGIGRENGAASDPESRSAGPEAEPDKPTIELTEVVEEDAAAATADSPAESRDPVVLALADRLETIAARLRAEGASAVGPGLQKGDRLDTLLSGLLAGYLAAD